MMAADRVIRCTTAGPVLGVAAIVAAASYEHPEHTLRARSRPRLPSELDMGEQYGGRRDAIRWSKEQLADQVGLVVLHGRGTFVPHQD